LTTTVTAEEAHPDAATIKQTTINNPIPILLSIRSPSSIDTTILAKPKLQSNILFYLEENKHYTKYNFKIKNMQ
jgi:hypothetical protein